MKNILLTALTVLSITTAVKSQSITASVITQPCNSNGVIGVTVTGMTAPISYTYSNWMANAGIVHSNVNSLTDQHTGIMGYTSSWGNPNVWTIIASDGTSSISQSVVVTPAFTMDSIKVIPGFCPALSTVQATNFQGGTSPYSCVWTNQNTNLSYSANPAAVPGGPYSLLVTDGAGCMVSSATGSAGVYVWSNSSITMSINGTPANCTNGTATVTPSGGITPYSYQWSNNASSQSISGLMMGYISCTVTDFQGCQSVGYYQVSQSVNISINKTTTSPTCLQNNGAIMSFPTGGTAPYSYQWSNGATTQNVSGLGAGNYYLTVTDANGCIGQDYNYLASSTPISVTYVASASSCTTANGAATVTPSGGATPYHVQWYATPTSTGLTISGKPAGSYSFKVTDANGCVQTGAAIIPPSSVINASLPNNWIMCPSTSGNMAVNVSGSNPPFTYTWSTGANTKSITSVQLGSYSCIIKDNAGCTVTKYGSLMQSSPVSIGLNSNPVTCMFATNGNLVANGSGGVSPYTYTWSTGSTGPSLTGLGMGYYSVIAKDANGCTAWKQGYVGNAANNSNCYCTIQGTVYADANSNCTRNGSEAGIPNVQVHCSGFGTAFTDANGVYSFKVPTGTYTISEVVQYIYPLAPCQQNNQVVSVNAGPNCTTTVNFANNTVPLRDLHIITTNMNFPVPGNTYTQMVIVQNDGSTTENNIKVGYKHDGQLILNSVSNWTFTQPNSSAAPNWYRINSGFSSLTPGTGSSAYLNYNVPTNIPVNTQVSFEDTTAHALPMGTAWLNDNSPWNNVDSKQTYVVASYDPNYKEVTPKGIGAEGNITVSDSMLTYVIHFQNTGSYYAQNVVLVDTLDADLRLSTVRPGYSDHKYVATMDDNGVMKFTFSNINLPWQSAYGDIASSGMITYSVKLKKNLPFGTKITNKAAIYFDYNAPVITNTTRNTLVAKPTGIEEMNADKGGRAVLFPNPARTSFRLSFNSNESAEGTFSISDISGREISVRAVNVQFGENMIQEDCSQLQDGIYFVQLKAGDQQISKKLVITH